jgi:tetratricopeptide (TPR) repeat protein
MRAWAIVLCLASCSPPLTPEQESDRRTREARATDDVRRKLELLDRAIEIYPTADAHLERALLSESAREPERALADLTAAADFLRGHPARATVLLSRALLLGALRRSDEAEADLTEVIRATGNAEAYLHRAWFRRRSGRAADAERDVLEARRVGDGLADPFYNEGVRALQRGDAGEAERMFRFALDLDPFHTRAHLATARMHMERHRFADAVAEFDQVIPAHPRDPELYYHRGNARFAAGLGEDALADFTKAIELAPREPIYWAARGMAQHRVRNDVRKAMADFQEAINLDQKCHSAWYHRGLLDHEQGRLEGAERDLRRALSIRASPEGCLALGRVLHDRGDYDKALSLFRQSMEIYKEPDVQKSLAREIEKTRRAKESQK